LTTQIRKQYRRYCPSIFVTYPCIIHGLPVFDDVPLFASNTAIIVPVNSMLLLISLLLQIIDSTFNDWHTEKVNSKNIKKGTQKRIIIIITKKFGENASSSEKNCIFANEMR
jgi:hypothetical protein